MYSVDETTGEFIKNNAVEYFDIFDTFYTSQTKSLDYLEDEKTEENCSMTRKINEMTDLQNNKRLKKYTLPKKGCDLNDSEEDNEHDNYSIHDTSDSLNYLDDMDLADDDESTEVIDQYRT